MHEKPNIALDSRRLMRWKCIAVGAALSTFCGGCVALPLATLGTVLGFAGTAASTGAEVYNLGKLDFSVMSTFEQCHVAAVAAAADLHLHITGDHIIGKFNDRRDIRLTDDRKTEIAIGIDRRTDELCQCRVDVGLFGSEPTAKLIMERMRRHLPEGGGLPPASTLSGSTR